MTLRGEQMQRPKNQDFDLGYLSLRCLLDVQSRGVRWAVEFMILELSVEVRLEIQSLKLSAYS